MVTGQGRVLSVDTQSRNGLLLVDTPPFDQRPDVSIQIGPVLRGTSLRDATGLVRFTDFENQIQFADVAAELNNRVLKTVLVSLDLPNLKGRMISFAGTASRDPSVQPPIRDLVPVKLVVETHP
jgi:predicted lipoprotein